MEVRFECTPIYTTYRFSGASASDVCKVTAIISRSCQARPKGYQHMPAYRKRTWDGYIRLAKRGRFPTGLLSVVIDNLKADGFPNIAIDSYDAPTYDLDVLQANMFPGITLRPYQLEAAAKLMAYKRGVARMATNSGKTEVFAAMTRMLEGRVLVLVTRKDLLHQTAERLENRLQEQCALVGDGYWQPGHRVTVGMIQTLRRYPARMRAEFADLAMVVYDECHHLPSKTSQEVMLTLPAPYRFGMSGTPLNHDNLADLVLVGATGPVQVTVTNADLVAQGISAEPRVLMYDVTGMDDMLEAPWREAYDLCIVQNVQRNAVIVDHVTSAGAQSTLILVDRLEHGHTLQTLLASLGAIFVHGSCPMDERRAALDALRTGNGTVVIATAIFDEGVDVPAVDLLVLAGGGKKHIKLLQRIGRGMRQKPGDNMLTVVDFVDDTSVHLLAHSSIRATVYEEEGFVVEIVNNDNTST